MNPFLLYLALVAGAVIVGLSALRHGRGPARPCPSCGHDLLLTARACLACDYRPT